MDAHTEWLRAFCNSHDGISPEVFGVLLVVILVDQDNISQRRSIKIGL